MDKWEYANVRVAIGGLRIDIETEVTFFHSNGKPEEKKEEFGKLIALMGDNGWEIIASNARTDVGTGEQIINYMFKRKKAA